MCASCTTRSSARSFCVMASSSPRNICLFRSRASSLRGGRHACPTSNVEPSSRPCRRATEINRKRRAGWDHPNAVVLSPAEVRTRNGVVTGKRVSGRGSGIAPEGVKYDARDACTCRRLWKIARTACPSECRRHHLSNVCHLPSEHTTPSAVTQTTQFSSGTSIRRAGALSASRFRRCPSRAAKPRRWRSLCLRGNHEA
jgi:hypothetical protein